MSEISIIRKISQSVRFPPLLLFLISFFLRLSLISKGPYHVDVLDLMIKAEHLLKTGELLPLFGSGYPLAVILAAGFIKGCQFVGIGDLALAVNLVSVVFGALAVVVFYYLAYAMFDRRVAVVSATLFSVTPIFLGLSVYGKNHVPALYFFLQSLVFLHGAGRRQGYLFYVLAGLSLGAMGAYRLQDLILLLPAWVAFAAFLPKAGGKVISLRREIALMAGVAGLVVLAFHLPFLLSQDRAGYVGQFARFWQKGARDNFLGIFSSQLFVALIYLLKTMTEVGFLISVMGLATLASRRRRDFIFLLLWILVPLLFYGNVQTGTTPRFFLIILPPFFLAQGFVLAEFLTKGKLARAIAFTTVGLIMYLSFGFIYPIVKFRHDHALLPEFCRWVAAKTEPQAVIVVTDENNFVSYYSRREVLARPESFGHFAPGQLNDFFRQLERLLEQGRPVYITTMAIFSYDRDKEFSTRLQENYDLSLRGRHLYEDWHKGEMSLQVSNFGLYKIEQKAR